MTTEKRVAHFTVTGEFMTQHARQLWADENQPGRAIDMLKAGLIGVEIGQVLDILTGRIKLIGDSTKGLEIVEDNATLSPCGQPLPTLIEAFKRIQERAEIAERDTRDLIELEIRNGVTVTSPRGLCEVSRQTSTELATGKVQWENVRVFREVIPIQDFPIEPRTVMPLPEEDEPEPPPDSHPKIVTDTGWLSPDGRFYPCGYQEHINMAGRIQRRHHPKEDEPMWGGWEHSLEKQGWVKVAGRHGALAGDRPATERQNAALLDWCMGEGKDQTELPWWVEPGAMDEE